jgi:hypothetical protein
MSVTPATTAGNVRARSSGPSGAAPRPPDRTPPMPRANAALVAVISVAAAVLLFTACSGNSKSSDDATSVARRSIQALIDHDNQAYLNELNPDYRSDPAHAPDANEDLAGCKIKDVRTAATGSQNVTVIFESPCGSSGATGSAARPLVGCTVSLAQSNGRAYTQDYACTT